MSKIKINLNKPFLNIDGEVLKNGETDSNMGKSVGNYLAQTNKGNAIKLFALAIDFHKTGEVEVDEADFKTIRDMVETNDGFANLAKAQVLKEMDDAKDASKKKEDKKEAKMEKVK